MRPTGFYPIRPRRERSSERRTQLLFWRLAWRHAKRDTKRQWGEHPVAIMIGLLVPWLVVGALLLIRPVTFSDALLAAGLTLLFEVVLAVGLLLINVVLAPGRMWREASEDAAHLDVITLLLRCESASALVRTIQQRVANEGEPIEDLVVEVDQWEEDTETVLSARPSDLDKFKRPVPLDEDGYDRAQRLMTRLTVKRARVEAVVSAVRQEQTRVQ